MTTISIAMTAYNASRYIGEQLDSFATQTRLPDELVITDDGSTDATPEIVAAFAARVPFTVRYERNERNLGMHGNFSRCVSLATGDLVFMSDDDDAWFPDKLAIVEAAFAKDPAALVILNDQTIADGEGKLTDRTVLENVRRLGYGDEVFGTGACTAMKREILPILLPYPSTGIPYDHWTNHLPHLLGVRRLIATPLQMYRRHGANRTGSLLADSGANVFKMAAADTGDMRIAYADRIVGIDLEIARLREREAELATIGLADAGQRAIRLLEAERVDHQARIGVLDHPRLTRPLAATINLSKGRYRRFQGWKSAAKDIVS